jgi:uncharacterized protein YgiM (DUF1202 family)
MKKLVLALLVIASLLFSGLQLVAAQGGGTTLTAISGDAVTVYAEANAGAEVVAEVAPSTEMVVLGTDESGNWLQVALADDSTGFVMADAVAVLNLPPLAPVVYVNSARNGVAGLFAEPKIGADIITSLPNGTLAHLLGTWGEFAYVLTPEGKGWSVAALWDAIPPEGSAQMVDLARNPEAGVFVEPKIGADIVGTITNEAVVYWLAAPEGEFVQVLMPDGQTGYALVGNFAPLSAVWVDALGGTRSDTGLFDAPDLGGNVIGVLNDGTPLVFIEAADDFWYKVYHPTYGMGYALAQKLSPRYTVATVQVDEAVVRAGPNDNTNNAIATLPAGTKVVVKGLSESGAWVEVGLPFGAIDFPYYGVNGWMRDFLFIDGLGNTDLDPSILSVTE